ncbi:Smr/MutS family protein [Croceicoccus naphthovorans]|uniref:DNA mismatch repair protein MutS n=1 Tax=Croceicoccus naphthovorans TaxID=1348774 RepID=A0A0G3XBY4_9SPHN|nr:Smr/MutS family protein [Croceicoccus naphthovorans]AKM09035.1 DNA mismatch repair protein MutS [Croceicoccus naphthovorans]MBB3991470.1 DNA-nicking Smr family endonuclease [Croceicoccus naphthovorans]
MRGPQTPPRPRTPRGLSEEEATLWAKVASTVTPLKERMTRPAPVVVKAAPVVIAPPKKLPKGRIPTAKPAPAPPPPPAPPGLDSHWERRLSGRQLQPDFTLDLHGHTLDQAHRRLDMGLAQAKAMGARVVLLVTGRPRPVEAADRGERRGVIRAKVLDWLAAGPHGSDIAAVRNAQRRHGGEGALYLILRRGQP